MTCTTDAVLVYLDVECEDAAQRVRKFCESLGIDESEPNSQLRAAQLAEYEIKKSIAKIKNKSRPGVRDKEKLSSLNNELVHLLYAMPERISALALERIIEQFIVEIIHIHPIADDTCIIALCMKRLRENYLGKYDGRLAYTIVQQIIDCLHASSGRIMFQ
ncbi:hypothetical protein HUZ36_14175 [Pseudoalteromonas sp. McH1-7]|uniref:hypothetical protein n=1 Tax=Pseudoalteromonas sp. McH1-7 TaxID=2745574 RepID=UPI0015922026|nr:hypothetical protein [Pseudoalteromonas sp. McH1-7]NUZ11931.1 hypothetical protein [Pseudoalteromonas sp. McH1-7]